MTLILCLVTRSQCHNDRTGLSAKRFLQCVIRDVRRRLGTRLTKPLLLVLHHQTPFHMGGGPGILLMFFADQLASLGWMVMASRLKTSGKLIRGF